MREIDFIPDSYRTEKVKHRNYRRQYLIISGVIVVMLAWSFITGVNVSKAKAQVRNEMDFAQMGSNVVVEFSKLNSEYEKLSEIHTKIQRISNRVVLSDVVAELSYLSNCNVVFDSINIETEDFIGKSQRRGRSFVKNINDENVYPCSQFRYRVLLNGIAKESSDVADLIKNLEESQYFDHVIPGFARNRELGSEQISEFELSCYVANYRKCESQEEIE